MTKNLSRREMLKLSTALGFGALLPSWVPRVGAADQSQQSQDKEKPLSREFNEQTLKDTIEYVVRESVRTGREYAVKLPKGEITVHRPIITTIPPEAKIRLVGHDSGSTLRLDPSLSILPIEWSSFGERNILYFRDVQGELVVEGIDFDGGSARAEQASGYLPPPSPWNAMVMINGKGKGDFLSTQGEAVSTKTQNRTH